MATQRRRNDRKRAGPPPVDLEKLRRRLLIEKENILALYREDVHAAREIQEDGSEEFEELATMDVDRELLLALSEEERERIFLIEEALTRMEAGEYGLCLHSGRPIPFDRLEQVPWARYCAQHQTLSEEGLLRD
jgi:DnaK suppressor protein